jgi:RNA polymerase sigma-70 factor (ECF subfamily)
VLLGTVDRAVFLLYLEDLTCRDMAEILGMSESHVGVRINRIKRAFIARYCDR